jgi:hypothetical protein
VELVVGRAQAGKHCKPVCAVCATLSCHEAPGHVTGALPAMVLTTDDASAAPPRPLRLHRRPWTVERLGGLERGISVQQRVAKETAVSLGNLSATAGVFLDRRQSVSWAGGRQHMREASWCWGCWGCNGSS